MTDNKSKSQFTVTFILAKGYSAHLFEKLIHEIDIIQGQIRHAFPPKAVIASIPYEKIKKLRGSSFVGFLTTDVIGTPPPLLAAEEFRDIISVWNNQMKESRDTIAIPGTDEGLSWDAPGHLPPDPPPQIRKMISDWERDMDKNG